MAEVSKARDTRLDRTVAIKILPASTSKARRYFANTRTRQRRSAPWQ
jgi:hypothetical protein